MGSASPGISRFFCSGAFRAGTGRPGTPCIGAAGRVAAVYCVGGGAGEPALDLYKRFVQFEACVRETILLFTNTPFVWAPNPSPESPTLLHNSVFAPDHP